MRAKAQTTSTKSPIMSAKAPTMCTMSAKSAKGADHMRLAPTIYAKVLT